MNTPSLSQVYFAIALGSILIAELSANRGTSGYFLVIAGSFAVLSIGAHMLFRKLFQKIDESRKRILQTESNAASLSLPDAKKQATALLQDRDSYTVESSASLANSQLALVARLGPSLQVFFADYPKVLGAYSDLRLGGDEIELFADKSVKEGIIIGRDGEHIVLVCGPENDSVLEIFEPGTEGAETAVFPSIYHYLVAQAALLDSAHEPE